MPAGGEGERGGHGDPQTPAWPTRWLPRCAPSADDDGHRQEREPGLAAAPVPSTSCRYSDVSRNEPNSTADAASIITKPPPTAAVAEPLRCCSSGCGGAQLERGERGEAGEPGAAEAERLRRRPAARRRPARARRRAPPRLAVASSAPRRSRPRHCGRADVGGHDPASRATATRDADGQVDEEDRPPVDELGERAAEQDADRRRRRRRRRPRRRAPSRGRGPCEGGRDDRQRGRGAASPRRGPGRRGRRRSAAALPASAEASDATVKTPRPVRKTRRRPSRSAARPPSSSRLPNTSE